MPSKSLFYLTIREAGRLIHTGDLSPVELTRSYLDRIDDIDGTTRAYITVVPDIALADARKAEAEIASGKYKGVLHGIPMALKDVYDTEGVRTTAGSRVMHDRIPKEDANAAARLKAAGVIMMGKLATYEFAMGFTDPKFGFPVPRNPWNQAHITGGSSTGSGAAVAAGLCMGSLGSDTSGSIRAPASHCGIVGLKPTYGRVSRQGLVPVSWTLDHCGPMARTVEDAALILQAIAGHDPRDPTTSTVPVPDYTAALREDIRGLRVGVPRHYFFAEDPLIDRASLSVVERALNTLEDLGARVEEVTVPTLKYASAAVAPIMFGEAFTYHRQNLAGRPQQMGAMLKIWTRSGALFTAADYVQAQRVRKVLKRQFAQVLQQVDVIASPTMVSTAPLLEGYDQTRAIRSGGPSFTAPHNLTGMPAISVPCGFDSSGLPVGLQIAGRPFDEATVLRVAHAYQLSARWSERRPPI